MLLMKANILDAKFAHGLLFGVISVVVPWLFFLPCLGKEYLVVLLLIRCLFVPWH